jgi:hypothetical protein
MARRFRSLICNGAATALLVCSGAAVAEPPAETRSLPQWVLRAQERLSLKPVQQRELRALVDENSIRMLALRPGGMAELQREFRLGLAEILTPEQLAEWDTLIEELLGEVHLRNAPRFADAVH